MKGFTSASSSLTSEEKARSSWVIRVFAEDGRGRDGMMTVRMGDVCKRTMRTTVNLACFTSICDQQRVTLTEREMDFPTVNVSFRHLK